MQLIESLEPRALFSTATLSATLSADLAKLAADMPAAKALFQQYGPTLHADLAALSSAAKGAGTPGHGALVAALNGSSLRFYATTRADALHLFAVDTAAARGAFIDGYRLAAHPTNVVLKARVTADLAAFAAHTNAVLTKLGADGARLSALSAAALDAVGTAYAGNATVSTDIATLKADGSAFLSATGPDLQAVQADLTQFLTDVAAGN